MEIKAYWYNDYYENWEEIRTKEISSIDYRIEVDGKPMEIGELVELLDQSLKELLTNLP
jgi:hypothetical protein